MFVFVFNFCYYAIFAIVPIVIFVFFSEDENFHSSGGFLYFFKYIFGKRAIDDLKEKSRKTRKIVEEKINFINDKDRSERCFFLGCDQDGNQLNVRLELKADCVVEITLTLRVDNRVYVLPKVHGVKSVGKYEWKSQGLTLEILEPNRRCRLNFNGFLEELSKNEIRHVKFNLLFNCCSKPNMFLHDDDTNLLTKSLAGATWRNGQWIDLLGDEGGSVQFGALKGTISGELLKEVEVNMPCIRRRSWGDREAISLDKYLMVFIATEDGLLLYFGTKNVTGGCQGLKFGFVLMKDGLVHSVEKSDLSIDDIAKGIPNHITVHIQVNNKNFKILFTLNTTEIGEFCNSTKDGYKVTNITAECDVNGEKAMGTLHYWCSYSGDDNEKFAPIPTIPKLDNIPNIIVTSIEDKEARILELTGGKGNSLALINNLKNEDIEVPKGFIITTTTFRHQLQNSPRLQVLITTLENVALGKEKGNLEVISKNVVNEFENTTLPINVAAAINGALLKTKRSLERHSNIEWAVRSSAIGEDSNNSSSAGQNATFLQCKSDDVVRNVLKCWGSLYSYHSVVYRRQQGLPIQTSMAVIVQQMVKADYAGVLFTCNPSDSNPTTMLINSTSGLGDSVVSASVEPDTIILKKSVHGEVTLNSSRAPSHYKELILKLGRIGVFLERTFGAPQDVEWAISKNHLYILQCRPVTTTNNWSDYELLHEFDTPVISKSAYYTRANVGEVFPFPLTPLTQTTIMHSVEKATQMRMFNNFDTYSSRCMICSHHFALIDVFGGLYARPTENVDVFMKMVDLSVFGHPVLTEKINQHAKEKFGLMTKWKKIDTMLSVIKSMWYADETLRKTLKIAEKLTIKIDDDLETTYKNIEASLEELFEATVFHCNLSEISIIYQTIVMVVLLEGGEIRPEHYNDLSLILSSCRNVISAEIPEKLGHIGKILHDYNVAKTFVTINPENGMKWLKENCKEAYNLVVEFLEVHGHRSLGEMELNRRPWKNDHPEIIKIIQTNCKLFKPKNAVETKTNIVDQLICPQKKSTRLILRFLIGKHQKAVRNREKSKSAVVQIVDKIRTSYKALGAQLTINGLLPSENLIYFLTSHEILQIIRKNNPELVIKATRRQKLYPQWNKLQFPEIIQGDPIPETKNDFILTTKKCQGTPVCLGEATGRACVISSLDQINLLREGDILITNSTDIGWSPYFPVLSGLVTELGGLVSHGAVVAREYGLPCIVGAKNATKIFKTGERILLSTKNGCVSVVED